MHCEQAFRESRTCGHDAKSSSPFHNTTITGPSQEIGLQISWNGSPQYAVSPKWPRQRDPGSSQQGLHSLSTMFFILFHRMNRKGNVSMLNAAVLSILDGLVSRIHCLLHLKCLSSGRRNESCRFAKHNKQTSIVGSHARLWSILLFSITMTALGRKQTKIFHDLRHACLVTPWTTCMLLYVVCKAIASLCSLGIHLLKNNIDKQFQCNTIAIFSFARLVAFDSCISKPPINRWAKQSVFPANHWPSHHPGAKKTYLLLCHYSLTVCGLLWYRGRAYFTPFRADSPHVLVIVMLSLGLIEDLQDLI